MVREQYPHLAERAATRRWRGRGRARAARVRAVRAPRRRARRRGRRRDASRTASRTTRPATRCAACASATRRCGCCAQCAASSSSSCREAEECCGFGGTFAVKNADVSAAMLADKSAASARPAPGSCTAADNSCLMHIGGGLARAGAGRAHAAPRRDPGRRAATAPGDDVPDRRARRAPRRRSCGATSTTRRRRSADKRARVVAELPDWEELREAGAALKDDVLGRLDEYLLEFEQRVQRRGGHVHWARDAAEANRDRRATSCARPARDEVVKVKSLTTDEIGLNEALAERGIAAVETDLAELIVQLGDDSSVAHPRPGDPQQPRRDPRPLPAHARRRRPLRRAARAGRGGAALPARAVPARAGRSQRRELRRRRDGHGLRRRVGGQRADVHDAARTLITVVGIEKLVPTLARSRGLPAAPAPLVDRRADESVHLALDRRHEGDGPREFHVVLLDNGRTRVLADEVGRQTLHCIRCCACLNVCPVYSRTGGHAYGSVYPGPIGAILTPQLARRRQRGVAAVRVEPVRRLRRRVPGQDRHPRACCAPARRTRSRTAAASSPERRLDARARARVRRAASGYERLQRARAARARPARRWRGCRGRCASGRARASCPRSRRRRSATGGRGARRMSDARERRSSAGSAPPGRRRARCRGSRGRRTGAASSSTAASSSHASPSGSSTTTRGARDAGAAGLATVLGAVLRRSRRRGGFAVPPDLPTEWRAGGSWRRRDRRRSTRVELDALDGALTGCAARDRGDGHARARRRARAGAARPDARPRPPRLRRRRRQVVGTVPEAFDRISVEPARDVRLGPVARPRTSS